MDLIKKNNSFWDPFYALTDLQTDLNRAFNRTLMGHDQWSREFSPDIEVHEEADQFMVTADLPGLRKEDLNISVQGNMLTLRGERKREKESKSKEYHYSERFFGSFTRTVELPAEVDSGKVKASYRDGVLEISLPKSESAKPKQIQIEVK